MAFFSGTDNNDDRNFNSFSGVVGKINDTTPATVWRFNMGPIKKDVKFEDIFDLTDAATSAEGNSVPKDWLERVEVLSSNAHTSHAANGYPTPWFKQGGNYSGKSNYGNYPASGWEGSWGWGGGYYEEDDELSYNRKPATKVTRIRGGRNSTVNYNPRYEEKYQEFPDYTSFIIDMYGEEVYDAFELIKENLYELEGCDDVIEDLINELFDMLSAEGRSKLMTNGLK